MEKLLIKGAHVLDPSRGIDAVMDLLIENGHIAALGPPGSLVAEETLDAHGKRVVPGFVDMHTHLREPGYEYKETIQRPAGRRTGRDRGNGGSGDRGDFGRWPAGSRFPPHAPGAGIRFHVRPAVISHCEDKSLCPGGVMNESFVSTELGLNPMPNACEEVMVARDILLAELTRSRLHVAHVSTAGSIHLVRDAKRRGVPVTCEVTPHHLFLTDEAVRSFDTATKVNPPLRTAADGAALREGLRDGTIDAIATDHAPHEQSSKELDFSMAPFGLIGLETAFPLCFRLVKEGVLTLPQLIAKMTIEPARILSIPKGSFAIGSDADLTILDLEKSYAIDVGKFRSRSRNCPFGGWEVQGKVVCTLLAGRIVYEAENAREHSVQAARSHNG